MKVLVTGAGGYIGGRLIPVLLQQGHAVRASFTDVSSAQRFPWSGRVETVQMDVLDPQQVEDATRDVDAVFYLIHGMGGADFADTDARAARNMAQAATSSRVGRIVYLSGIVPPVPAQELSEHVASRLDVERLLSASDVPTITVRAAIVLGSGSTSFEILRQISERLPIQAIPPWMNSEVQPIAVVDVLDILEACLHIDATTRSYDVGGDERLRYADLLDLYAQLAGLQRPQIDVPLLPTMVAGWLVGQLTDVPSTIVEALVQSLRHDMVCSDDDFLHDLRDQDRPLTTITEAITRALAGAAPDDSSADQDPLGPLATDPAWAGGAVQVRDGRAVHAASSSLGQFLLGPNRRAEPRA